MDGIGCGPQGPTTWDKNNAKDVYTLRPAELPGAQGYPVYTNQLVYWWWDTNWTEDHVAVHIRKWDGTTYGSCAWPGQCNLKFTQDIAPCEGDFGCAVDGLWSLLGRPAGLYRACYAPWNAVTNSYPYYTCASWQYVGQ
jgi:hypothetical protein